MFVTFYAFYSYFQAMENTDENMSTIMMKYTSPKFPKLSFSTIRRVKFFNYYKLAMYVFLHFELWAVMISARNGYLG